MSFLHPEAFWILLPILIIFIKKDFRALSIVSYGYILTALFIAVALSRPIVEQEPIESKEMLSDVVLGVDLSFSMQGNDLEPTRLSFAKKSLEKLVYLEPKTRFGVLGFTTNAIVLSPLTEDRELLLHLFSALDEKNIITRGSSIMPALELARKMSNSKKVSVVLLTDGADESNYEAEAKYAKENSLVVNIFMLATATGSSIRLENGELLKDESANIIISAENSAIKAIADATGGIYTKDFDEMIGALSSQKQKDREAKTTVVKNLELFYYFIFLAIITFLVSITTLKRFVLAFLLLFGINLSANQNSDYIYMATKEYRGGNYEEAIKNYEGIKSGNAELKSVVYYNIGNSFVRLKEYEKAREAYIKSLTLAYSRESDENLQHIQGVAEEKKMTQKQKESEAKSSLAKKEQSQKQQKEGGGSNMQVSAPSSGSDDDGKKSKSESQVNLNSGKAKLSSKQYELINKRGVSEKKPW